MPTYIYKFTDTGETIEVQQTFSDPSLTEATHPLTGATMAVKKVFTPVGVSFKGGGFYKTDSRGGKSTTASVSTGSGSESTSSAGDSSASSSSDTAASTSAPAASSTPSTTTTKSPTAAAPKSGT